MNSKWMVALAVTASGVALSGVANADEKDRPQGSVGSSELAPVKSAVEMTIGTGYMQGFGKVDAAQPSLTDVAKAGGGVQAGVGYRILPQLTLGGYGSWAMFSRGDQVDSSTNIYSATAGFQADLHFLPDGHLLDPWISLGSGWRGYWMTGNQGTTSIQGMEIAKFQVGVDYRIDKAIAISPVVGVDINTFFTQSTPEVNTFANLQNPRANAFLFAGMQGRFDIPTGSQSGNRVASR
jgi:hypothetical protein